MVPDGQYHGSGRRLHSSYYHEYLTATGRNRRNDVFVDPEQLWLYSYDLGRSQRRTAGWSFSEFNERCDQRDTNRGGLLYLHRGSEQRGWYQLEAIQPDGKCTIR